MTRRNLCLAIAMLVLVGLAGAIHAAEPIPATGGEAAPIDLAVTPLAEEAGCGFEAGAATEPLPTGHHKDPPPPRTCGPCSDNKCAGKLEGDICEVGLGVRYCFIFQQPLVCSDGETYNCTCI